MKNIYLEITNICNLNCSFCHGTKRKKHIMTTNEFEEITDRLKGKAEFLFFHVMGEPLLHPNLTDFIRIAKEKGLKPCITSNGTLLSKKGEEIADSAPYRFSISLHAPEANGAFADKEYINACIEFAREASKKGTYVAMRLWNTGGLDEGNQAIISQLQEEFPGKWEEKRSGWRIADRVFLEKGEKFDWPDLGAQTYGDQIFCHGIRDQIGILVDGTVVPCCLDADGCIKLGNIFESSLEEILMTQRAKKMYDGFSRKYATEELCRHCGYAALKKMH